MSASVEQVSNELKHEFVGAKNRLPNENYEWPDNVKTAANILRAAELYLMSLQKSSAKAYDNYTAEV